MKKNSKKGITISSIIIYVLLFFAFTSVTTTISSRFNKNLFNDRGMAINITALNKLQYNLLASANESYNVKGDVEGNTTTLTFSNSDVYVFDLDKNTIFKNGGKLVNYIKEFDVKLLDDIIDIDITVNKYTNELTKSIQINVHTEDYVDNGLIAHLDGINNTGKKEHNYVTLKWQDLVNESINVEAYAETGEDLSELIWTDDGIIGTRLLGNYNKGSYNAMTFQVTVHFVDQLPTGANYSSIIDLNGSDFLSVNNNTWLMSGAGVSTQFNGYKEIEPDKTVTLTFVQSGSKTRKIYYNGESPMEEIAGDSEILNNITFNSMRLFANDEKIYKSVRVYNRALTDSEIKHNYMIDRLRFGE